MLKKIGAMVEPITIPPLCLFGTPSISFPKCHCMELIADFLLEPVPTTSPTYTTSRPLFLSSLIFSREPVCLTFSIALACKGISLLVKASPAGLKSSVLVSPATLKTTH